MTLSGEGWRSWRRMSRSEDSRARWTAEVVPALDRVDDFVVSVFDGRWVLGAERLTLSQWMRQPAAAQRLG